MSWEKHGDKTYYYKKQRIGGKVKSIYIGTGELAELISGIDDAIRRAKRPSAHHEHGVLGLRQSMPAETIILFILFILSKNPVLSPRRRALPFRTGFQSR